MPNKPNKWTHCRYCGAQLRRDPHGQYCPTRNCQWQYGLPESEDTKRNVYKGTTRKGTTRK